MCLNRSCRFHDNFFCVCGFCFESLFYLFFFFMVGKFQECRADVRGQGHKRDLNAWCEIYKNSVKGNSLPHTHKHNTYKIISTKYMLVSKLCLDFRVWTWMSEYTSIWNYFKYQGKIILSHEQLLVEFISTFL